MFPKTDKSKCTEPKMTHRGVLSFSGKNGLYNRCKIHLSRSFIEGLWLLGQYKHTNTTYIFKVTWMYLELV